MNKTIVISGGEVQVLSPMVAERYRNYSDGYLITLVTEGDVSAGAFLVFYRYGATLLRLTAIYAEHGCYDVLLGELVSEVYCHFSTFGWSRMLSRSISNMEGYLFVVERNLIFQIHRRDSWHVDCVSSTLQEESSPQYNQLATTEQHRVYEVADQVGQALSKLSQTRQFVLNKRFKEGYDSREVAAMLPDFWRSIGELHTTTPTNAYVDNLVSAARRELQNSV